MACVTFWGLFLLHFLGAIFFQFRDPKTWKNDRPNQPKIDEKIMPTALPQKVFKNVHDLFDVFCFFKKAETQTVAPVWGRENDFYLCELP